MKETLKEILQKIEKLQDEMRARYDEMAKKYSKISRRTGKYDFKRLFVMKTAKKKFRHGDM